jgi:hypothetical protein
MFYSKCIFFQKHKAVYDLLPPLQIKLAQTHNIQQRIAAHGLEARLRIYQEERKASIG